MEEFSYRESMLKMNNSLKQQIGQNAEVKSLVGEKKSEVDETSKRLMELESLVKSKTAEVESVENRINLA